MTLDYRNYSFDDFSRDEFFRQWVFNPDNQTETFWINWISQNPDCVENLNLAKAFLLALREKEIALDHNELALITDKIVGKKIVKVSFWQTQTFKIAASVAILLGLGFWGINYYSEKQKIAFFEKISPNLNVNYIETKNDGTQIKAITLQDGSVITLYPKSQIRYPKEFTAQVREVYLVGQAFFDIAKNPTQPFWVYTNYISTQVLGTRFMVKALEDEKNVKVEVHAGKVSVYRREDLEKSKLEKKNELTAGVILTPNQEIEYSIANARLMKSISKQTEVVLNELPRNVVFDEAPISKVFAQLEKDYEIQIVYDAKKMENCYLTASFSDETLYDKLNLICKITHSSYEIIDNQVFVHGKGC